MWSIKNDQPKPAYKKAMWGEEVFKCSQSQRYKLCESQNQRVCVDLFVLVIIHS